MSWKCPACGTPIRRELIAAGDEAPRPGSVYTCGVCHLPLVLDEPTGRLTVAPAERHQRARTQGKH